MSGTPEPGQVDCVRSGVVVVRVPMGPGRCCEEPSRHFEKVVWERIGYEGWVVKCNCGAEWGRVVVAWVPPWFRGEGAAMEVWNQAEGRWLAVFGSRAE